MNRKIPSKPSCTLNKHADKADSNSFKKQLFRAFILMAAPILAIMCVGSFFVLRVSTQDNVKKSQIEELERINTQLLYIINDTENMSREIIFSSDVQKLLTDSYSGEQYPDTSAVAYYINSFIANRDFVDCVVLTGTDYTIFSTERAFTDVSAFHNIEQKWWYQELTGQEAAYEWFANAKLDAESMKRIEDNPEIAQQNTLMLARPIYSMNDYQTLLGYMMIYLDEEYLENIITHINWGETTGVMLVDKDGNILLDNHASLWESVERQHVSAENGCSILFFGSQRYVVACSDISENKWITYMVTPYREVDNSVNILKIELAIMVVVIILLLFLISKYSASYMSKPIVQLSKMMDTYHGEEYSETSNLSDSYETRTDEIGQMYRSYNQMQDRLNKLIQEIYIKNLEKKDAELALLQSQINPHFLYNTLDSINWMALANDQDEISEMITALSDTFRLSLMKNSSSFVDIEQEIQYIKSYLVLQKFRYADRLQYTFELPEILPQLFIPRFILQPVVENALKHGIDHIENGGKIIIRLSVDDCVTLTVVNDGSNINLDKMQKLLYFDEKEMDMLMFNKDGYGVQNINRRIKIICGDAYGLTYSIIDGQTVCGIVLPVKEEC